MILVDANLLLYAYDSTSAHHAAAKGWLEDVLSGSAPVGIPEIALLAFLRISTHPRAMAIPLSMEAALSLASDWLSRPPVVVLDAGERHFKILQRLCVESQVRGPLVMDAHLAALAIEHGAELCTTDRDFSRFRGLKFSNPLERAS